MSRLPVLVALLLACALILSACGGDEKEKATSTPAATETAEPAQEVGCEKVAKPQPANEAKLPKPTTELKADKTYVARVLTNCGEFEITLDAKRAPRTGGSFKYLVDKRFYDGLTFHRIIAGYIIQAGDPLGTGEGGPGYSVVEAPPRDLTYTRGVVAMAKRETEPAGLSGSQYFITIGEELPLGPDFALLGKVTKGQEVVDKISVVAVDANEAPTQPVVIRQIRITVS